MLKCGSGANLEVVPVFRNGIQAEGLQVRSGVHVGEVEETTRYAEVIWADTRVEKTRFFSPPESSFQFGLLAHEAGYREEPHYHKAVSRQIDDLQQMFVVQRGVVDVLLYTDEGELFRRVRLAAPGNEIVRRDSRICRLPVQRRQRQLR